MRLEEIFSLENFNIIEDTDNYYFFRALNKGDNNDIESGITLDINSQIERIRTDRERYDGVSRYNEYSQISLQEIHDHIKMHHSIDTNCISLTSNANAALLYGRGYYKDKYIMVKVPKKELGNKVVNAGLYMMQEIEKVINDYISKNELDSEILTLLNKINNAKTQEELLSILKIDSIEELIEDKDIPTKADNMFQKGITYNVVKNINTHYKALNDEQNLEKNKLIAKINLINKRILPNVNNTFLVQTIGNAFSALELIHYGDITQEELIDVPKEIVDIFSLLQQLPKDYPFVKEIKQELLNRLNNGNINLSNYQDKKLDIEDDYTIEKMYLLTGGHINYETSTQIYKKSFFLAKSKLRTLNMVNMLNNILGDNPKYQATLNYILNNTFGVEPEIAFRHSSNTLQISESISLDFKKDEKELFDLINNLSINDLETISKNPFKTLPYFLKNLSYVKENPKDQETYYANAIIDLFDWSKLEVVEFSASQRNDLVQKLKENHCLEIYNILKEHNIKEKDIANVLLTMVIKEKDINSIDLKDTFTVDELEQFLGYYRINATQINLRNYQATTLKNIDKTFQTKQFVSAILPTGAGKSFVALAEMLVYKDKEIIYLAPNDSILEQIENYIVKYIYGETVTKSKKDIIKEVFPNLKLQTYSGLLSINQQEYINHKYDLIVLDELHRSGAIEWKRKVEELLQYQDSNAKVLGITATPQRDADMVDMSEYWAKYYGYTEEEIGNHKHMAINMDLVDAIKLGYVVNPKVVNCEYTLKDGEVIEHLLEKINLVKDESKKNELLTKFERLRRSLEQAEGIEEILSKNIKKGGKYIVFCPVTNKKGQIVEDIDGIIEDSRISGNDIIDKYINQIKEHLKNSRLDIEFSSMLGSYSKSRNSDELSNFEIDEPDKTKFMIVMNKLNEGIHVKDIDGIIWLRPLDENSKILYLQQLGRIIHGIDPNSKFPDEKRPIAIDLVNNTLRVNIHKNKGLETNDLDLLRVVCDWIKEHNNKIPDINSFSKIESRYASILKRIQEKYSCYLINQELINNLEISKQKEVKYIIDLGLTIDLWEIYIPEKTRNINNDDQEIEVEPFEISGILRDFCELDEEIDKNIIPLSFEEKLKEIYEIADGKIENIPKTDNPLKFKDNKAIVGIWIKENSTEIKKFAEEGNEYAILVAKARGWISIVPDRLKEIYEIAKGKIENVPQWDDLLKFSDNSAIIGGWIKRNSTEIKKLAEEGNEHAILVAKSRGWLSLVQERLKEIYEIADGKIENIPKTDNPLKFKDNSAIIGRWINFNKDEIKKLIDEGNKHAILVAKSRGWLSLVQERLKEIYEIADGKIENIPKTDNPLKFKDNKAIVGIWIKENSTEIKKLAEEGNEHAILVAKARGWISIVSDRLKEIYELVQGEIEKVPKYGNPLSFRDNTVVTTWIARNSKEIKKLAEKGNEHAILVAKAKGWIKFESTKETFDNVSTFKKVEEKIVKSKPKKNIKKKGDKSERKI